MVSFIIQRLFRIVFFYCQIYGMGEYMSTVVFYFRHIVVKEHILYDIIPLEFVVISFVA